MQVGIIGFGFMGATHLASFSKIPGVEVSAICTQSERSLTEHLAQAGGNLNRPAMKYDFTRVRHFTHWRELVLDPAIAAVDICLPTDLHAAVTIASLAAGKHVLCEKPMALTDAECDRMLAAAEEQKRVLMVGQVLRFWPAYGLLEDFVRGGKYGAITGATLKRSCGLPDWSSWLPVEARSGGAVLDLLVHDIDQALLLFGIPQRAAAKGAEGTDAITAELIYASGLRVRVEGGWLLPGAAFSMSFEAKAKRATLELDANGLSLRDDAGAHKITTPEDDAYDAEVGYFIDCCQTGRKPDRCPPQASAQAVKLALLLKKSRINGGEEMECLV